MGWMWGKKLYNERQIVFTSFHPFGIFKGANPSFFETILNITNPPQMVLVDGIRFTDSSEFIMIDHY